MNKILTVNERFSIIKHFVPYWHHLPIALCIVATHQKNTLSPGFEWSFTYSLLLIPAFFLFYCHYLVCMPFIARLKWYHGKVISLIGAEVIVYFGISSVIVYASGSSWDVKLGLPDRISFLALLFGLIWHFFMSSIYYLARKSSYIEWQKRNALKKLFSLCEVITREEREVLMNDLDFRTIYTTMQRMETDEYTEVHTLKGTSDFPCFPIDYALNTCEYSTVLISTEMRQIDNLIKLIQCDDTEQLEVKIVSTVDYQNFKIIPLVYLNLVLQLLRASVETPHVPAEVYIETKDTHITFTTRYIPQINALKYVEKSLNLLKLRLRKHYPNQFTLVKEMNKKGYLTTVLAIESECLLRG